MPFLILIPVFLLLAVLVIFASMRRRDTETAVGQLSRETRKRDRGEPAIVEPDDAPTTGREIEKAASIERRPPHALRHLCESSPAAPGFSRSASERNRTSPSLFPPGKA